MNNSEPHHFGVPNSRLSQGPATPVLEKTLAGCHWAIFVPTGRMQFPKGIGSLGAIRSPWQDARKKCRGAGQSQDVPASNTSFEANGDLTKGGKVTRAISLQGALGVASAGSRFNFNLGFLCATKDRRGRVTPLRLNSESSGFFGVPRS